ncbi:MAG: hypothetical protein GJ676_03275 [Rhodobacteraceae bacterium]|nr:hypothetical protein [Paracoccaceae bacterium]
MNSENPLNQRLSIQAYFINMDRDVARKVHMQEQSERLGVEFKRVPAVEAASLDLADVPQLRQGQYGFTRWEISRLSVAVFLSHRRAWQNILESNADQAIVMEDDLVFHDGFVRAVNAILASGIRYDVVRLNTSDQSRLMGAPVGLQQGFELRRIFNEMADAGCYLVSRHACEVLLAQSEEFCDHLDDFVFSPRRKLDVFQLTPPVAGQVIHEAGLSEEWLQKGMAVSVRENGGAATKLAKGPLFYRVVKELSRAVRSLKNKYRSLFLGAETVHLNRLSEK